VKYEVVSDRPCLIGAVGEMVPGEPVVLDEIDAKIFESVQGIKLTQTKFPNYVKVTVVMDDEE
jgi:hypothetical protein